MARVFGRLFRTRRIHTANAANVGARIFRCRNLRRLNLCLDQSPQIAGIEAKNLIAPFLGMSPFVVPTAEPNNAEGLTVVRMVPLDPFDGATVLTWSLDQSAPL
ncbi:MAG: hypothetical protein K0R85_391 [Devosia sp.]|jgi:hypothetical protein|nr:hypothetical protein [Devosia sp.]